MSLVAKNGVIACVPFDNVKKEPGQGLSLATPVGKDRHMELLHVVHGTEAGDSGIFVGNDDAVFVKSSSRNQPWAKEVYTLFGKDTDVKFILVPLSEIVFIGRNSMKSVNLLNKSRTQVEVGAEGAVN